MESISAYYPELIHKHACLLRREISQNRAISKNGLILTCFEAEIELLIRTNVYKALEPLQVILSVNNGPYTV